MTNAEIEHLIKMPKHISVGPSRAWKQDGQQRRKDFKLESVDGEFRFRAFARQSLRFDENFSIGLEYEPSDGSESIILIRCNGPHGSFNGKWSVDHPHYTCHIHRASEQAIEEGKRAESRATVTSEFSSIKQAIRFFLAEVAIDSNDQEQYFADDLKLTLFDFIESDHD